MPDGQLFRLARADKLNDPLVLRKQVARMLSDPRSEQFSTSFAEQWLALDKLGTMPPDAKGEFRVYYREQLETAMLEETHRSFAVCYRRIEGFGIFSTRTIRSLTRALPTITECHSKAMTNTSSFRVSVPPGAKPAGSLDTAVSSRSPPTASKRHRSNAESGCWLICLGTPPPPPPKAVPALTPDLNGAVTVREMLEEASK